MTTRMEGLAPAEHGEDAAPPRRSKVPRPVRERQMLEVAGRVFAVEGYHGASMDVIAVGVGVTKPMLYAYFGSKEGLYLAYMRQAGAELLRSLREAADPAAPPRERLWEGLLAFLAFVDEHRNEWRLLYGEAAAQGGPFAAEVGELRGRVSALVTTLVAGGRAAGRRTGAQASAHALVGACESVANWWLEHPDQPRELVASRLMGFAWLGLERLSDGEAWPPPLGRPAAE
jgi:AcrR family transcriptional regulator